MKKCRSIITVTLSFLITLSVVLLPMRTMAAESYGYVGTFTGDIQFSLHSNNFTLPLHFAYSNVEHYGDGTVRPSSERVVYSGGYDGNLKISGETGTFLNGSVFTYFKFTHQGTPSGTIHVQGEYMNSDNISMFTKSSYINSNESLVLLLVQFNNFEFTDDVIELPIYFNVTFTTNLSTVDEYVDDYVWIDVVPDEWQDQLTEYTDVRDLPGYIGDFAQQNQQIIDGIDQNTSAVTTTGNSIVSEISDAATYIGNQIKYYIELFETSVTSNFNQLTSNLANWYNGMTSTLTNFFTPYFDNITDAFKKALSDTQSTDNDVLSGAMDDYQAAEQVVFSPAMDSLTEFDFESHNISSLGTGFVAAITFVSSCLTNMYDLTPFSVVFEVIATLGLASICIGLSRLWFGKKGR